MPAWTLHDLRRSFVTHLGELGVAPHIIEAVVNRQSGTKGGVAGVYNKAQYNGKRREALELWGKHVTALVAKPKPVAKTGATASPRPHKAAA